MEQGKGKRGAVEVFLQKDFFNSLISVLSVYSEADETNRYSIYAQRLKRKILQHSRKFIHDDEENAVTYFYEEEAAILIKLLVIYINASEKNNRDYFPLVGKKKISE